MKVQIQEIQKPGNKILYYVLVGEERCIIQKEIFDAIRAMDAPKELDVSSNKAICAAFDVVT